MQVKSKSDNGHTAAADKSVNKSANKLANKRTFGLIFFVMLMDVIGLSIIIPVAPFIVQRFSNDAFTVTALTGIYAAAQFVAAPALGKISDRVGRRPVLLISVLGSAIGYFIFGIGGALWVLFVSRVIDGITGGNMSTASAYIADVSAPEDRPKNFAMIGMAFGLGFILGPALGGAVSQISIDAPAFTAGILSLVSVALIFFVLPESLPKERREQTPLRAHDFNPLASIGAVARKPRMGVLLVVSCIFAFAFDGINSTLGVFTVQKFNVLPWEIGALFVVTGIITAVTQAVFVAPTVKRYGEKTMTVASMAAQGLSSVLVYVVPAFWMLYPIGLLRNGVGGFIWATLGSLMASKVEPREQGALAGANTALQSLMAALGPLVAGATYDHIAPGAPFSLTALLFGLGALLIIGVKVPAWQPQPAEAVA